MCTDETAAMIAASGLVAAAVRRTLAHGHRRHAQPAPAARRLSSQATKGKPCADPIGPTGRVAASYLRPREGDALGVPTSETPTPGVPVIGSQGVPGRGGGHGRRRRVRWGRRRRRLADHERTGGGHPGGGGRPPAGAAEPASRSVSPEGSIRQSAAERRGASRDPAPVDDPVRRRRRAARCYQPLPVRWEVATGEHLRRRASPRGTPVAEPARVPNPLHVDASSLELYPTPGTRYRFCDRRLVDRPGETHPHRPRPRRREEVEARLRFALAAVPRSPVAATGVRTPTWRPRTSTS